MAQEEKIALLTDSTCDLPMSMLDKLPIRILPLKIIYSDQEYRDRVEISPSEIYEKFDQEIPSTSMPAPQTAKEKLQELKEEGYTHVLAIHISSGLSGTYNMVKMVADEIKGLKSTVIDSKSLSIGLGRMVLKAGELIEQGLDFEQIVDKIQNQVTETDLYFIVKTLKYLKKGGRIGKVKGTIGELLNIKPVISINEAGEYYTFKKSRGRKRSINALYKIAKKQIKQGLSRVNIMHADAESEARNLLNKLNKLENVKDTYLGELGPGMVVHAGPGLIGLLVSPLE